jgi:hypothetical protein
MPSTSVLLSGKILFFWQETRQSACVTLRTACICPPLAGVVAERRPGVDSSVSILVAARLRYVYLCPSVVRSLVPFRVLGALRMSGLRARKLTSACIPRKIVVCLENSQCTREGNIQPRRARRSQSSRTAGNSVGWAVHPRFADGEP